MKPGLAMNIDAALYSGSRCYFFKGNRYIRVTRSDTGPGTGDPGDLSRSEHPARCHTASQNAKLMTESGWSRWH
jgi:Hemopexin